MRTEPADLLRGDHEEAAILAEQDSWSPGAHKHIALSAVTRGVLATTGSGSPMQLSCISAGALTEDETITSDSEATPDLGARQITPLH